MNKLDLIIAALENSEPTGTGWVHVHEQKHQAALAAARELKALEPVAWVSLIQEAQAIVEGKYLFKRFIDGTPLSNDIAVWMTEFALKYAALAQPEPPFQLTDAGADTNITRGLEPKGSGMVTLHQREWVGLTDDDMESLVTQSRKVPVEIPCDSFTTRLLKLAEQTLKDKNTT